MTLAQWIERLEQRIERLFESRQTEGLRIASDLLALVQDRVQSSGVNYQGSKFAPYTTQYAKSRRKAGYQTNYVDFTRTGQLWGNIAPEVTSNSRTKATITIQARTQRNIDILRGARAKRGNILRPSPDEIEIVREANRKRILNVLTDA